MSGTSLFLSLILCCVNFQPSQSQGFQPIVHYVLTPVELFRIPRPDYQPQIQVLPTEDLGPLVVNHPSNEYFRNLLINTVSYDPIDLAQRLADSMPGVSQQPAPVQCQETTTAKTSPVKTIPADVDIVNATAYSGVSDVQNNTSEMVARIIDDAMDTSNVTDLDDEDDTGSVEATTPRLEAEEKSLNKTDRIVTRRSPSASSSLSVSSGPVGRAYGPRHYRRHLPHRQQARAGYGVQFGSSDHDNYSDSRSRSDVDSSYSDSDSYEYDEKDGPTIDPHDLQDSSEPHDLQEDQHSSHPSKNDKFLGTHEILGDVGDDLFRFDHKNTDHKVLNYKRADRTVQPQ